MNEPDPEDILTPDEEFILTDLKENYSQCSWDWPADERFAEHLKVEDTLICEAMDSGAPLALRIAASSTWHNITQKRIAILRGLCKLGYVDAYWAGTGPGGKTEFGVNRIRTYALKDEYH